MKKQFGNLVFLAFGMTVGCADIWGFREVVYTEANGGNGGGSTNTAACFPGDQRDCYTGPAGSEGVGICQSGTETCAMDGLTWGPCLGEVLPAEEQPAVMGDEACDGYKPSEALWSRLWGDESSQRLKGAQTDNAGNIYLGGSFQGGLNFTGSTLVAAAYDIFIAKLDPNGKPLWAKAFTNADDQWFDALAVDSEGNLNIVGSFLGDLNLGGKTLTSSNTLHLFAAKFDTNGNHVWSQSFGESGANPRAHGLATDSNGDVVITGSYTGPFTLGAELVNMGSSDGFVAKLSAADGLPKWSVGFGDDGGQVGVDVAIDVSGNIVVAGIFSGVIDFGPNLTHDGGFGANMFVLRFDSMGGYAMGKAFGGFHLFPRLALDPAGDILLAGWFSETTNFGGPELTAKGAYVDIYVAKLGSTLEYRWANQYGVTNFHPVDLEFDEAWVDIDVTPSYEVLLSTHATGTVDFGDGVIGYNSAFSEFLAKFDKDGMILKSQRFGDFSAEGTCFVRHSVEDSPMLACTEAISKVDFGAGELPGAGSTDIVVTKFAP